MQIIDADTHVIENEHTWDFMEEEEQAFRPLVVVPKHGRAATVSGFAGTPRTVEEFWIIDGRVFSKASGFVSKEMSAGAREASDVEARLAHMDELGVDIHVIYPSLLGPLTRRPEVDVALQRSYNRWVADICDKGKGRLRWAAVLPLLSMDKSLEELRWAKDHGACAFMMHGVESDRRLSAPYFFPLYKEAAKLDLPACVHATSGSFAMHEIFGQDSGFSTFKLPVVGAFHDLVMKEIPAKFPDLRWGFIEVSAQWIPYAMNDLEIRFRKRGMRWPGADLVKENRIFVACQTADDLPKVLECAGEDNIVIGSDYGHNDTSAELEALRKLKTKGTLAPEIIDKILYDNAKRLYAL